METRRRPANLLVFLLPLAFALAALALARPARADLPDKPPVGDEWQRTPIAVAGPRGLGCAMATHTTTAATLLRRQDGRRQLFTFPAQILVTNSSTAAVTICASQDLTPIIHAGGWFLADSTNGGTWPQYSAGQGACMTFSPGTHFFGLADSSFSAAPNAIAVGGRRGVCGSPSTGAPCSVTAECIWLGGGTCTLTGVLPRTTYLFAVNEAGAGTTFACEVR